MSHPLRLLGTLLAGLGAAAPVAAQAATTWTWTRSSFHPLSPTGFCMGYDQARQRVVLFGGDRMSSNRKLDDTWEWNGSRWLDRTGPIRPPGRAAAAMAWDPNTGKVLLFGGASDNILFGDTWLWDGITWQQVQTPAAPPARWRHRLATDPVRRRIVLFGGSNAVFATSGFQDTWEWDGQQWLQQFPATRVPAAREGHAMAYHAQTGRVAMFGGSLGLWGYNQFLPVEEWDGADWVQVPITGGLNPGYVASPDAVPDPVSGGVLLLGLWNLGRTTGPWQQAQYRWSNGRLTAVTPTTTGPLRSNWDAVELDVARGELVAFGGVDGLGPEARNTWAYDVAGNSWRRAADMTGPPGGQTAQLMAHIPWEDRFLVLYWPSQSSPAETWVRDDAGYRRLQVGPGPRWGTLPLPLPDQRMVIGYDGVNRTIYAFDGTAWSQIPQANWPTRPVGPVAYDPAIRKIYFAGNAEIWTWDLAGWTFVTQAPGTNYYQFNAFDQDRRVLVRWVNNTGVASIHEWDGTTWTTHPAASNEVTGFLRFVPGHGVVHGTPTGEWLWNGSQWTTLALSSPPPPTTNGFHAVYDANRLRIRVKRITDAFFEELWDLRPGSLLANTLHPRLGTPLQLTLAVPGHGGEPWLLGLSTSLVPGIPIGALTSATPERVVPLAPDWLLDASLATGLAGILDPQGRGQRTLMIPPNPALDGFSFHAAALTITPSLMVGHLSQPLSIHIGR